MSHTLKGGSYMENCNSVYTLCPRVETSNGSGTEIADIVNTSGEPVGVMAKVVSPKVRELMAKGQQIAALMLQYGCQPNSDFVRIRFRMADGDKSHEFSADVKVDSVHYDRLVPSYAG